MVVSENNLRDHPHWIVRLMLRCLLVAASLSLLLPYAVSDVSGSSGTGNQLHLTSTPAPVTVALGKSSQIFKNTRNHNQAAGGPDLAPDVTTFGYLFLNRGLSEHRFKHSFFAFIVEHILFRNDYRAIPARAPPMHFLS